MLRSFKANVINQKQFEDQNSSDINRLLSIQKTYQGRASSTLAQTKDLLAGLAPREEERTQDDKVAPATTVTLP